MLPSIVVAEHCVLTTAGHSVLVSVVNPGLAFNFFLLREGTFI